MDPTVVEGTNGQLQPQVAVKVTKFVEAANQLHACDQSLGLLRQISRARQSILAERLKQGTIRVQCEVCAIYMPLSNTNRCTGR